VNAGRDGALTAELVALRRHLHAHPELSWHETATTAEVAGRLRAVGLDPQVCDGGTGLVCDVTPAAGPTADGVVVLRADLDALPVQDAKDCAHRSQVDGVAHACGHDVHTVAVLGAALALAARRDELRRTVRCVFQPSEEAPPSGARFMIDAGALDDAVAVFALHCDPRLDAGRVGLRSGAITSAFDQIVVSLEGPGGHTARPHLTVDLVTAAARVAVDLPAALARRVDTRSGVNLTFGALHVGDAPNVIPTHAELRGTLRTLDRQVWQDAETLLGTLLGEIVAPYGARHELTVHRGAPPVVNDASTTAIVRDVAVGAFGPDAVAEAEQSLGGDDFAWFTERVPGTYVRLGVRTPGLPTAPDLHADDFDVDESAIGVGVQVLAGAALAVSQRD
jgi:amidohydrolase